MNELTLYKIKNTLGYKGEVRSGQRYSATDTEHSIRSDTDVFKEFKKRASRSSPPPPPPRS